MKSILVVTAYPPSMNTAGQAYTLRMLNELCKYYTIGLVYFYSSKDVIRNEYLDSRIKIERSILVRRRRAIMNCAFLPFVFPLYSKRFSIFEAIKIKAIGRKYTYVYFDFSQTHIYSVLFEKKRTLLMVHDVIAQKYARSSSRFVYLWAKHTEKIIFCLKRNKSILCFSKKDKDIIKKKYNVKASVIDFFIDEKISNCIPSLDKGDFCLFGAWRRRENTEGLIWFLDKVKPLLNTAIKISIIGGGLDSAIIKKYENIIYRGFVENPYEEIAGSMALIAPLFSGAGVKVKVVEALACGSFVIGTAVALEGIDFVEEKYLLRADTETEFANAINKFFEEKDRRKLSNTLLKQKELLKKHMDMNYPRIDIMQFIINNIDPASKINHSMKTPLKIQ